MVTQQQLADYANTNKMMTYKVLIVLEKKDFIERIKDTADSRAKQLKITDKGKQALKVAYQVAQKVNNLFFNDVIKDKAVFDDLLLRLIK